MNTRTPTIAISEQPLVDTALAAGLALAHAFWVSRYFDPWGDVAALDRQVIFQTGAGVVAIISSLASVGLAAGGAGERGRALRRLYGKELRRNWRSLLVTSAAAPMVAVVAQIADSTGTDWAPYLFEFAMLWAALRVVRLAWLIDALTRAEDLDNADPGRAPAKEMSNDFQRRMLPG